MKSGAETSHTPHKNMKEQVAKVVAAFKKMRDGADIDVWSHYCDDPDMDQLLTELGILEDLQTAQGEG